MKIIDWIDYDEAENKEENGLGGLGGFFDNGMRWKDYLEAFKPEYHLQLLELKKSIITNHIRCTGSTHQNGSGNVPLWENGKVDTYSFRAWGDLMAAVWSTEEDFDYSYLDFYC